MARVMIVDDNIIMRKNIKTMLEGLGHVVVDEAENGKSILVKYSNSRPDLITLDIVMEQVDGLETLKILKEHYPESRVVMLTSINKKSKILESVKLGADSYVLKPFNAKDLQVAIDKVMAIKQSMPEPKTEEVSKNASIPPLEVTKEGQNVIRLKLKVVIDEALMDTVNLVINRIIKEKPYRIIIELNELPFANDSVRGSYKKALKKLDTLGIDWESNH